MKADFGTGEGTVLQKLMELQLTVFILTALGFLFKKLKIFGKTGQKNLTDLVIDLVMPCNIVTGFLSGASREALGDCLQILLLSVGLQAFCVVYGKLRYRKTDEDRKRSLQYGVLCPNAGFLGNPIAEGVFGATGLMYASVYLIPQRIMMWSEGLALFSGEKSVKRTLVKVVTHPCILACLLGIVLLLTGWTPPDLILTPVGVIGRCNTALSMLVIGMILGDMDLKKCLNKTVILFTVERLLLIPALVLGVCLLLPVDPTVRDLSVLLAAMPAGATTGMLAAKYDRDPAFATSLVVFSTLCSVPALPAWAFGLQMLR